MLRLLMELHLAFEAERQLDCRVKLATC
jgi:hypothetical protein